MKKVLITSLLTLAATTSSFGAVKAGKFGMDFSFAGSLGLWTGANNGNASAPAFNGMPAVGFRYHLTDMIALAPAVGFYTASGTNNNINGSKTETSLTAWGLGLEIPIYLVKFSAMDFYVAPGVGYASSSTTEKNTSTAGVVTEGKATGNHLSLFAAIGLQIPINDQLHAFAKTTIGYVSATTNPSNSATNNNVDDKSSYFGLQSWAVGAIFYFN
jgi:hypothetical protein